MEKKNIYVVTGIAILIIAAGILSALYLATPGEEAIEEGVVLRFTSPPDPNLIPASVLLAHIPHILI